MPVENMMLWMALSAAVSLWAYDHFIMVKVVRDVIAKGEEVNDKSRQTVTSLHDLNNENVKTMAELGRRVVELSNKVEALSSLRPTKMFNETRIG